MTLVSVLGSCLLWFLLLHWSGPLPDGLGPSQGHLQSCLQPQHCARARWTSSQPDQLFLAVAEAIDRLPRSERLQSSETYLHVAVSSLVFGFTDDLEVLLDQQGGAVELRSESRLGESDFGVNRNRLRQLRSDVDRFLDAG